MRRLFTALVIAASTVGFLAAMVASADARTRKKNPRILVITKRSFLDSGKYPAVGSMNRYVTMDTVYGSPAYMSQRSRYGLETLPGRFGPNWPN